MDFIVVFFNFVELRNELHSYVSLIETIEMYIQSIEFRVWVRKL